MAAPVVLSRALEVAAATATTRTTPTAIVAHSRQTGVRRLASTSKSKPPGSDPLDVLKKECVSRNLCDKDGGRLPGSHWVVIVSTANDSAPGKVRDREELGRLSAFSI